MTARPLKPSAWSARTPRRCFDDYSRQQIDRFELDAAPWLDSHTHVTVRYLAIKSPDGPRLAHAAVEIASHDIDPPGSGHVETKSLIGGVVHEPIRAGTARALVTRVLRSCAVPSRLGDLKLLPDGERWSARVRTFADEYVHARGVLARATLTIEGHRLESGPFSILSTSELSLELKSHRRPYVDFDDFCASLGILGFRQRYSSSAVSIWIGPPLGIDPRTTFSGGRLSGGIVVSPNVDTSLVKLGIRAIGFGKSVAVTRRLSAIRQPFVAANGTFRRAEVGASFPKAHVVTLLLQYRGRVVHEYVLGDATKSANLYAASYKLSDPELKKLKTFLSGGGKKQAVDFEVGVVRLLSLLGFNSLHAGAGDSADIKAFTPRGRVLLVECTTGRLSNKDKLGKLATRHVQLRDALDQSHLGWVESLPLIVTALRRADVESDLGDANVRRIAVVTAEDIATTVQSLDNVQDPDAVFERLRNTLPQQLFPPLRKRENTSDN